MYDLMGRPYPANLTPPIGERIIYWRCGDDNIRTFAVPPVGGCVILRHLGREWERFAVGRAWFVRRERRTYTEVTAVGDCPGSLSTYERVA